MHNHAHRLKRQIWLDARGKAVRSIRGWTVHRGPFGNSEPQTDSNMLAYLVHRLAQAENAIEKLGGHQCCDCGAWDRDAMVWHRERHVCPDCADCLIIDDAGGFKVETLAGYIIARKLWRAEPDRVRHWAEYLLDDDDPASTDLFAEVERRMRKHGAPEFDLGRMLAGAGK